MAVGYIKRLAGPYTGAGTTALPFGFKIFEPTDVYVAVAANSADQPVHLVYGTDYTVSMNESQDATPGGTVTLVAALSGTQVAVVGSALAYTQETQLTNYNRFPPEIVNTALDRIVVQIQQIIEQLGRVLKVPETADVTPEELIKSLQDAAETATVIAKGYAEAAKKSEEKTAEYAEAAKVIAPISAEIKTTADHTDSVKTTADNIDAVKTVAANAEDVRSVAERIDDVSQVAKVAPHIDDVSSIKEHIDEVHRVGQDLVGMSSPYLDLGSVTETPDETTKVVDGYIKKVAEHIDDCIHPVGDNLDAVKTVAEQLAPINDVADLTRIDYEAIFLNGLHEEGDSNGLSN